MHYFIMILSYTMDCSSNNYLRELECHLFLDTFLKPINTQKSAVLGDPAPTNRKQETNRP